MQITRPHHESGLGIYAQSIPVEGKAGWDYAKAEAGRMIAWLDDANGKFDGEFPSAFAIAHAQVVESLNPFQFFVVAKELVAPENIGPESMQTLANTYFEARAVFNCEILEAPEKVIRKVPQRRVGEVKGGKAEVTMEMVDRDLQNVITVKEGCMSFPQRSERNMDRKYRIKVKYQYLAQGMLGEKAKTFEGWVEGLKAHIIQHECEHFAGKNIHFK